MSNSYQTDNLTAGMTAFHAGVYVVSHANPSHAAPHEVLIAYRIKLPGCNACAGARFSFKAPQPELIRDNEFFRL
jgi:hypothetical protein